jgi:hypothetical protein
MRSSYSPPWKPQIMHVLPFVFFGLSNICNVELTNQSVFRNYTFRWWKQISATAYHVNLHWVVLLTIKFYKVNQLKRPILICKWREDELKNCKCFLLLLSLFYSWCRWLCNIPTCNNCSMNIFCTLIILPQFDVSVSLIMPFVYWVIENTACAIIDCEGNTTFPCHLTTDRKSANFFPVLTSEN